MTAKNQENRAVATSFSVAALKVREETHFYICILFFVEFLIDF